MFYIFVVERTDGSKDVVCCEPGHSSGKLLIHDTTTGAQRWNGRYISDLMADLGIDLKCIRLIMNTENLEDGL